MIHSLLLKKCTQSVLAQMDEYIDYFEVTNSKKPGSISIAMWQFDILKKEANTNKTFYDELKNGTYRNVKLKVICNAAKTQTNRI